MAREKATITVDRDELAEARELLGAPSASAAVDVALLSVAIDTLSALVRRLRLRADLMAYARTPPSVG